MASTSSILCTICNLRHNQIPAKVWCPECDEGLCVNCQEHHDLARLTKEHRVIKVEEYDELLPLMQSIKQYCEKHNDRFEYICPQDETLCCRKCITTQHKTCTNFMTLEDVICSSTSSALFDAVEQNLNCQTRNLEMAKNDREGNKKLVIEQNEKFRKDIKTMREKVKEYLDQLEKKMFDELDYSTELQKNGISKVIEEINGKSRALEKLKDDMMIMKENKFDLKAFLAMRKLNKDATLLESDVQDFIHSSNFDRINVDMSIASEIATFLAKIKSLGTVRIVTRPRAISMIDWRRGKIQAVREVSSKQITNCETSLALSSKINAPKGKAGISITGCALSPSGQILLADFSPSKRILTINGNGTFEKDINFIDVPVFDLTCIDSTKIGFSTGSYREVKIIDTAAQTVSEITRTSGNVYGITFDEERLVYCVANQNIKSFNTSDETESEIQSDKLKNNSYVCCFENRLYHTSQNGLSVSCSESNGKVLWTFCSEKLKQPRGITVDSRRNVYVVGEASNNLIVITEDGSKFTELLTKTDELKKPTAVCYDRKNDVITVCNKDGRVFIYKVQQCEKVESQ
ncbi:unnamed protein product [Mytilus coruscus]|uniref:B box-type domain-containing protein n=1 Tax=Mytilus coruscus TaxID=42192 RepID=A0A6J8DDP7_MYTCO|nr:unnamed protein product [Mytilus coruscus]